MSQAESVHTPSRRRFLLTAPAAAVAVGKALDLHSDPDALALGQRLDTVQQLRDAFDASGSKGEDPHYDAHWEIRERINAIKAKTLDELRVKARAAMLALRYDVDAASVGPGSFVSLSQSLAGDLLAIGRA